MTAARVSSSEFVYVANHLLGKHAKDRMIDYHITSDDVKEVLQNPELITPVDERGTCRYMRGRVTVVVNPEEKFIVTLYIRSNSPEERDLEMESRRNLATVTLQHPGALSQRIEIPAALLPPREPEKEPVAHQATPVEKVAEKPAQSLPVPSPMASFAGMSMDEYLQSVYRLYRDIGLT